MMERSKFMKQMQHKVAVSAVPLSAVRGQGAGVLHVSQNFLKKIRLSNIKKDEISFRQWLNRQTNALLDQLPVANRPWGTARKVINLFLRDALYNQYLSRECMLDKLGEWLEIPLDGAVAKGLKQRAGRGKLPPWPGLKELTRSTSDEFQEYALLCAQQDNMHRVHLDIFLWLENR
jgi:hypothetical protein